MEIKNNRLRELDFLRGIAIVLVLVRHIPFSSFTTSIGWVGVDLFFVLSGFLVSGLLFKEYIKSGSIQPVRFLIRRGFKIYPLYYLFYIPYLLMKIGDGRFYWKGFAGDMLFMQNFVTSWGWAYPASWSLAVEEHFYFALAFLLPLAFSKNMVLPKANQNKLFSFPAIILMLCVCGLLIRLVGNVFFPASQVRLFTNTQYRHDSLLAGVFVSWHYYFKRDAMVVFFNKYKPFLYIVAVACLCWLPFYDAVGSLFSRTVGFSLLYISFGIVLTAFLVAPNINKSLNSIFTKPVVNAISKVGVCSYSVYLIHTFIINLCERWQLPAGYLFNLTGFLGSIAAGIVITYAIEKNILRYRDRRFPMRG